MSHESSGRHGLSSGGESRVPASGPRLGSLLAETRILLTVMTAKLGKCANHDCPSEFRRLGTGEIYSIPVEDPQRWGLPAHVRQKVAWLCSKCAQAKKIKFDRVHGQVLVVTRHGRHGRAA